jgi:hypothetical protein
MKSIIFFGKIHRLTSIFIVKVLWEESRLHLVITQEVGGPSPNNPYALGYSYSAPLHHIIAFSRQIFTSQDSLHFLSSPFLPLLIFWKYKCNNVTFGESNYF